MFCSLFLGIMFLILFVIEKKEIRLFKVFQVYGQVPLFYFVVHWYILHSILFLIIFLQGFKPADLVFGFNFGRPKAESGIELWAVYLVWVLVVVIMYPLCQWFGKYKIANKKKMSWLQYI